MNCDCGKGADVAVEHGQVLARAPFPGYIPCDNPSAVKWYCAGCSPMTIKAHCMGMEFPKRDTDGPNVRWAFPLGQGYYRWACNCGNVSQMIEPPNWKRNYPFTDTCPKCADLDAVAEEQRVKEKTGG